MNCGIVRYNSLLPGSCCGVAGKYLSTFPGMMLHLGLKLTGFLIIKMGLFICYDAGVCVGGMSEREEGTKSEGEREEKEEEKEGEERESNA